MDNIVYLDVETQIPESNQIHDWLLRDIEPDARLKDPTKIKASLLEREAKALTDTPLQPIWGQIGVLCWAQHEDCESAYWGKERDVLNSFNEDMKRLASKLNGRAPVFCGFNLPFDLRFIWTRMLVNRIRPAVSIPHDAPAWSDRIIDLRARLSGSDRMAKGGLQDWVVALGGEPRADDLPGKDVPAALASGDSARVEQAVLHCRMDVNDCIRLHERILKMKPGV